MLTSKVFMKGKNQAILLPKEYKISEKELYIKKVGNVIILFPKNNPWEAFEQSLAEFTPDFMSEGRDQPI